MKLYNVLGKTQIKLIVPCVRLKCIYVRMHKFHSTLHHSHIPPDTEVKAITMLAHRHMDMLLLHYTTQFPTQTPRKTHTPALCDIILATS